MSPSPAVIMLHSPLVGPATLMPTADELRRRGWAADVPDLRDAVGSDGPRPAVVADAVASMTTGDGAVVLVAHSNAGLFVPVAAQSVEARLVASVFVDALIPEDGASPVTSDAMLALLRQKADADGWVPRWIDWWDPADVATLFPDEASRATVEAELRPLPIAYFEGSVPCPSAWAAAPCGYVQFGATYDDEAQRARARGWPVRAMEGEHLHTVVDPDAVADVIIELASSLTAPR